MTIQEIIIGVWYIVMIIAFLIFLIAMGIYSNKQSELRKKFVDSLDEHDKSVVVAYLHIKPTLKDFKKNGRKS